MRDELVIATKVGAEPHGDGGAEGLSAAAIERGRRRSRKRLGIDAIDLYWAHGEDPATPLEETVGGVGALAARGAVRRLGASNHPTWRVERARAIARSASASAVDRAAAEALVRRAAARRRAAGQGPPARVRQRRELDYVATHPELHLWVYSPLVQGSYDRADRPFPDAYDHPGRPRGSPR